MSTMAETDSGYAIVLARVVACDRCEADRRPRMFICDFHEGWWDGWESALSNEEGTR